MVSNLSILLLLDPAKLSRKHQNSKIYQHEETAVDIFLVQKFQGSFYEESYYRSHTAYFGAVVLNLADWGTVKIKIDFKFNYY